MSSTRLAISYAGLVVTAQGSSIASHQQLPCVEVIAAAQKLKGDAFSACKLQRQSPGPSFLGLADPTRDCMEFARLYDMAKHFSGETVSASDFCSTLVGYSQQAIPSGMDNRLADHGACVVEMGEVLASGEVSVAAEHACKRIENRFANAPVACAELVASLAASKDELLDAPRVCDRLVTGSGNGTQSLDEKHFVYSCVQYAANLISDMPKHHDKSAEAVAAQVQTGCEAHMPPDRRSFCPGYADLVRHRAERPALTSFCVGEYAALHITSTTTAPVTTVSPLTTAAATASASTTFQAPTLAAASASESVTSAPEDMAAALPSTPAPVALHAVQTELTSQQKSCMGYLDGIQQLHLPHDEDSNIVQMDCPKRFGAHPDTCARVAQLFAAGQLQEACLLTSPHPAPNTSPNTVASKSSPNMTAICESVVFKVSAIGLSGQALEQATVEVCVNEMANLHLVHQLPATKVTAGCHFIGKHLSQMQGSQQGPVDRTKFCGSLASPKKTPPAAKAKDQSKLTVQDALALHAAAHQMPISLHAVAKGSRNSTTAAANPQGDLRQGGEDAGQKKQVNLLRSATRNAAAERGNAARQSDTPASVNATRAQTIASNASAPPAADFLNSFLDEYTAGGTSKDDDDDDDVSDASSVAKALAPVAKAASGDAGASRASAASHASNTSDFLTTFLDQNGASLLQDADGSSDSSSPQPAGASSSSSLDSVLTSFADSDA